MSVKTSVASVRHGDVIRSGLYQLINSIRFWMKCWTLIPFFVETQLFISSEFTLCPRAFGAHLLKLTEQSSFRRIHTNHCYCYSPVIEWPTFAYFIEPSEFQWMAFHSNWIQIQIRFYAWMEPTIQLYLALAHSFLGTMNLMNALTTFNWDIQFVCVFVTQLFVPWINVMNETYGNDFAHFVTISIWILNESTNMSNFWEFKPNLDGTMWADESRKIERAKVDVVILGF